jgi:hypothetical protein
MYARHPVISRTANVCKASGDLQDSHVLREQTRIRDVNGSIEAQPEKDG